MPDDGRELKRDTVLTWVTAAAATAVPPGHRSTALATTAHHRARNRLSLTNDSVLMKKKCEARKSQFNQANASSISTRPSARHVQADPLG